MGSYRLIMILQLIISLSIYNIESKDFYDDDKPFTIIVDNGHIIRSPLIECKIVVDTTIKIYNKNIIISDVYFGLISYECGTYTGYLISRPKCLDCGIYCIQNDLIASCEHVVFPFVIGALISVMISVIITLIIIYKIVPIIRKYLIELGVWKKNRKEKKFSKLVKNLKTKSDVKFHGDDIQLTVINPHKENIQDRELPPTPVPLAPQIDDFSSTQSGSGGYIEPTFNTVADIIKNDTVVDDFDAETIMQKSKYISTNPVKRLYPLFGVVWTILSLMTGGLSCDQTLFLSSTGQICDGNKCQELTTYNFHISSESNICFKNHNGDITTFQISDSYLAYRYIPIYKTANWWGDVTKTWRCKSVGYCDHIYCKTGSGHPDWKDTDSIHIDNCASSGLGCDTMCLHEYKCVWYRWSLLHSKKLYTVYSLLYQSWSFTLNIKFADKIRSHTFSTNHPSTDLDIPELFDNMKLPIHVSSVDHIHMFKPSHIIKIDDNYLETNAAELGMPKKRSIGDLQVALNGKSKMFDTSDIQCSVLGCEVLCKEPESGVNTILKHNATKRTYDKAFTINDQVQTVNMVKMHTVLTVGNVDFKNLLVIQPLCDIKVSFIYGCVGCLSSPYIVFESYNIKQYGIMNVITNCTSDRNYIPCSNDPFKMVLDSTYKYCWFFIPKTNQTLNVEVEYNFIGDLHQYNDRLTKAADWKYMAKSVIENPNFINGITFGIFGYGSAGILITLTAKILSTYFISKKVDDINKT